jgi:hypothetical protein
MAALQRACVCVCPWCACGCVLCRQGRSKGGLLPRGRSVTSKNVGSVGASWRFVCRAQQCVVHWQRAWCKQQQPARAAPITASVPSLCIRAVGRGCAWGGVCTDALCAASSAIQAGWEMWRGAACLVVAAVPRAHSCGPHPTSSECTTSGGDSPCCCWPVACRPTVGGKPTHRPGVHAFVVCDWPQGKPQRRGACVCVGGGEGGVTLTHTHTRTHGHTTPWVW